MSQTTKGIRAVLLAILVAIVANAALTYASGVPAIPSGPRPAAETKTSGVPWNPTGYPRP